MSDGYAYELPAGADPFDSEDDDWDTVMVVPSEARAAAPAGTRVIDGRRCSVFRHPDGRHFAQLPVTPPAPTP